MTWDAKKEWSQFLIQLLQLQFTSVAIVLESEKQ